MTNEHIRRAIGETPTNTNGKELIKMVWACTVKIFGGSSNKDPLIFDKDGEKEG